MPADGAADASSLAAVLFDMDGLLVDTEHCWGRAEREVMAWLGHPDWTEDDTAALVGGPLSRVARIMVERSGSDVAPDVAEQRLVDTMARLLESGAEHRPGAPELLDDLAAHHIPCALVSSSPRVLVDAVLRDVGGEHFALTLAGDEVPRTKPFPDPYLEACRRLAVAAGSTVVLEDSPDLDAVFRQGYRGSRYSFGYPACPDLEEQTKLLGLLDPERIGVALSEEFQLVPEQSTSAIIAHHPEAKYFNAR